MPRPAPIPSVVACSALGAYAGHGAGGRSPPRDAGTIVAVLRRPGSIVVLATCVVGLLAAASCHPKSERVELAPPETGTAPDDAPSLIPMAVACPAMARCLGILDDLSLAFGIDAGLPPLDGDRAGLMRDEPGSAWFVVDGMEELALIVELPVDDTYRFAGSFVDEGVEVESLGDDVYRVGEFTIADDGPMMLLSRNREALQSELYAGRPEIPSEPDVIAKAWVARDAFPEWVFERFDEVVAARYEAAERAGDNGTMAQLNLLVDTLLDTTDLELVLREDEDDWVVEAGLFPGEDTWSLHRAQANEQPKCPLSTLVVAEDIGIIGTVCERGWARPREDSSPPASGPFADVWRGFFDPNFVVEGAFAVHFPLSGFAALRMPDPEATTTGLAGLYLVLKSGSLDLPLKVYPMETKDDRVVYRVDILDDDPTSIAATVVDGVALLTFGPGAAEELDRLAGLVPTLEPTPSTRIGLRVNLDPRKGAELHDRAGFGRPLVGFDTALTLTTVDEHDVWSLRIHSRLLHGIATSTGDTEPAPTPDLGPGGA